MKKTSAKYPDLDEVFEPDGLLSRALGNFEPRPEQLRMAASVRAAFQEGSHLCVEAGTGTGKTLAYLVPAILSGHRVVVSTGTRALQEQLIQKDIPLLGSLFGKPISACVVKGRSNYLCLERFEAARHSPQYSGLFARESLVRIGRWVRKTATGDRAELDDLPEDFPEWKLLDARREICIGQECAFYNDCFVTRVRHRASDSQIVIVNHHLFFADLAIKDGDSGGVLPEYQHVIFDEAHEIEDVATQFFGISVNNYRCEEWKRDLDRAVDPEAEDQVSLREQADYFMNRADGFFKHIASLPGEGRRRLFARGGPSPEDFEGLDVTASFKVRLSGLLSQLARIERTDLLDEVFRRLREFQNDLNFVLAGQDKGFVYWRETRGRGVFLRAAPIKVADVLRDRLFGRVRTVVLTSATLSTNGHFEFVRRRLGLDSAREIVLGSHFRYDRQAVLYIPPRICDPRHERFPEAMADEVLELLSITEGRAFVLFTSYQQMHRVYSIVCNRIPYPILVQGEGSIPFLLEAFRSTPQCVLFGTTSFWQGVDVQGPALSCVIVEKIPFSVPSEPLVEARLEEIRDTGGDPFTEYQVPEAIILLKQGVGRLIRSQHDQGVIAILDQRLLTRGYGRQFMDNLPGCEVTHDLGVVRRFFRG